MNSTHTFTAPLWLYQSEKAAWHFVTVPEDISAEIKFFHPHASRGWGSVPVSVTIGATTWHTSIFPDSKTKTYILPIKADVRKKESLTLETLATVQLTPRA